MSENNYGALMLKSALDTSVDVTKIIAPGIYPVTQGNASVPDSSAGLMTVVLTATSQKITFQKESSSVVYSLINGKWKKPEPGDVGNFGTAAFCDVTKSTTDDATGRVLTVGYQGIGGNAVPLINRDFNQLSPSGFINGQTNGPSNPTLYMGFNVRHADAYQFTLVGRQQRYFAQCCEAGVFKGWDEFYTTAHKPTAADVGALPITGGNLLGALRFLSPDARPNTNCMIANDDASGILACQYGYYQDRFDIHFYDEKGAWESNPLSMWRNGNMTVGGNLSGRAVFEGGIRVYSPNNPPPATDLSAYATRQWVGLQGYATQSWVLQNFVQNIDLTAPTEFQFWDGRGYMRATDGAAMYNFSMVGGSSNVGWIVIRYTRKQVNGTWYVIN